MRVVRVCAPICDGIGTGLAVTLTSIGRVSTRLLPAQQLIRITEMNLSFAIGDIHGRDDLLEKAFVEINRFADRCSPSKVRIICLGDYVDRGPSSRQVVERLMREAELGNVECLRGNHEALMIEAYHGRVEDYHPMDLWLMNGGAKTMLSYTPEGVPLRMQEPTELIPVQHINWMKSLPVWVEDQHRVYVHAGLMPKVELKDQREEVCMWIRDVFLKAPAEDLPKHVVHGHTPVWERKKDIDVPELLPHRTNLDTGAFHTGVLSVGVFDDDAPGGPVDVLSIRA